MTVRETILIAVMLLTAAVGRSQEIVTEGQSATDTTETMLSLPASDTLFTTTPMTKRIKRDYASWRPKTKKAVWLSAVLPGAGQIYNRKFWKLPIIYGGFVGCLYAIHWNDMMYDDYSRAYVDIMDDDPSTASYNQFLHLGTEITDENSERYANVFKRRKDYYRRYRDLSYIILVGVYALQIIDAYVDAALSDFDINDDLTLSVSPTVITLQAGSPMPRSTAFGLRCCITF